MTDDFTDVQTKDQRAEDLKAIGWVSYLLHLIVAVGAVIPGAQPGAALLLIALVIDLVKERCRRHLAGQPFFLAPAYGDLGRCALCTDGTAVDFDPARLDRLGADLPVVPVSHRARHGRHEQGAGSGDVRLALLASGCLAQPLADSPSSAGGHAGRRVYP